MLNWSNKKIAQNMVEFQSREKLEESIDAQDFSSFLDIENVINIINIIYWFIKFYLNLIKIKTISHGSFMLYRTRATNLADMLVSFTIL